MYTNTKTTSKTLFFPFVLLAVIFFLFLNIGDLDSLRQGTEGFYLQIAKEMSQGKDFLTPKYLGNPHWSKPPLHFWIHLPIQYLFPSATTVWASRVSIAILSLLLLFFTSRWVKRNLNIPMSISFIFLFSTVGIFKYSKIYMMEAPLAFLGLYSGLKFYDFIRYEKFRDLILSGLFMGLSLLVKGPISMVMIGGGIGLFLAWKLIKEKKLYALPLINWVLISLLVATPWFLFSYLEYGRQFLEYFFIRENFGKFASKDYPTRVLFQGLILYGLPWTLFIPLLLKRVFRFWEINESRRELTLFLTFCFLSSFIIWFFPSQKSHHYAFPALPFLLLLIMPEIFSRKNETVSKENIGRILDQAFKFFWAFLLVVFALVGLILFAFPFLAPGGHFPSFSVAGLIAFSFGGLVLLSRSYFSYPLYSLFTFSLLGFVWSSFIPKFTLPYVPEEVRSLLINSNRQLAVVVRKPYFVSEAIGKKVKVLDGADIKNFIGETNQFYLVHKSLYESQNLSSHSIILSEWPIWRRGIKVKDIVKAIDTKSSKSLKEKMVLLGKN